MAERRLDLSSHHPTPVSVVANREFDLVVTIGDQARERLPAAVVGGGRWMHWDIADPARAGGTPDSEAVFRRTAADIADRLPRVLSIVLKTVPTRRPWGKLGIGTGLWAPGRYRPAQHLPMAAEAGFSAIELNLFSGRDHFDHEDPAAVRELQRVTDDQGIGIWSIHAPDVGSLASRERGPRVRQLDAIRRCLELAAKVIPSHALLLGPFQDDLEGCEARMADLLAEFAADLEPSPAVIAFENGHSRTPPWGDDPRRAEAHPGNVTGSLWLCA